MAPINPPLSLPAILPHVSHLTISTSSGKSLIDDLTLSITPLTKLAIIGSEGTGKSTLLKVLSGQSLSHCNVSGTVVPTSAPYLPQSLPSDWLGRTVLEFLLAANPESDINAEDWLRYPLAVRSLIQVGLKAEQTLEQKLATLSGGELVKVQLAKLFNGEHNILLLDEPTNSLDLKSIKWLEHFLTKTHFPIVFVSHDEMFVQRIANQILYLQHVPHLNKAVHRFNGNGYTDFLTKRKGEIDRSAQLALAKAREEKALKQRIQEEREAAVSRNLGKDARKIGYTLATRNRSERGQRNSIRAISRMEKQSENSKPIEIEFEELPPKLFFEPAQKQDLGNTLVNFKLDSLHVEGRCLFRNVELRIYSGDKLVITGENGVGKSSLITQIVSQLESEARFAFDYLPQNFFDSLRTSDLDAVKYLLRYGNDETRVRSLLSQANFSKDETRHAVSQLSGGQHLKLMLLRLALSRAGVFDLLPPNSTKMM